MPQNLKLILNANISSFILGANPQRVLVNFAYDGIFKLA